MMNKQLKLTRNAILITSWCSIMNKKIESFRNQREMQQVLSLFQNSMLRNSYRLKSILLIMEVEFLKKVSRSCLWTLESYRRTKSKTKEELDSASQFASRLSKLWEEKWFAAVNLVLEQSLKLSLTQSVKSFMITQN